MKQNILSGAIACLLVVGTLSGCGSPKAISLVNTLRFDTENFQSLQLDYDADDIRVLEGERDQVVLKEYMNEDQKEYYAKTTTHNGELLITEGKRPRRSSFEAYVELFIPPDYSGDISLHSTSGTIEANPSLNLTGDLKIDTTSGMINVSNLTVPAIHVTTTRGKVEGKAFVTSSLRIISTGGDLSFDTIDSDTIYIETTSANIKLNHVSGAITYKTKSGKLVVSDITGYGSFHASGDGAIEASFTDVTGDISAYSKNGSLTLILPSQLQFKFSATTKEGFIETSYDDQLTVTDNTTAGIVGSSPDVSIELETRNGDIEVLK